MNLNLRAARLPATDVVSCREIKHSSAAKSLYFILLMSYSNRVFIFLFSCSKSSLCIGYQYTSAEACRIISTKEGSNDTLRSEERNHLFSKGNFETKTNKTEFTLAMICVINFIRTNLLTVLLFQHFFQTQCLVLSSTYQRATPLSPYISFFSLYLAFIYISCV